MKRRLTALGLSLLLGVSLLSVPVSAAERPWEDAYASIIRQHTEKARQADNHIYVTLADFDRDGTPELAFADLSFSDVEDEYYAATFKNGTIQPLKIGGPFGEFGVNMMQDGLAMYKNNSTGAYKIEAEAGYMIDKWDHVEAVISYWISNNTICSAESFSKEFSGVEPVGYYIEGKKVSASMYNSAYSSRNNGWSKVNDFQAVTDIFSSSTTSSQITGFLSKWKSVDISKPTDKTASPTSHSMTVDGKKVSPAAYIIDDNNYFKLRDIASLLSGTDAQFQVNYDQQTRAISLITGQSYTSVGGELASLPSGAQKVIPTPSSVYVDGKQVSFTAYNINGNNYFKLRDLGQALGFSVDWDSNTQTIIVKTT